VMCTTLPSAIDRLTGVYDLILLDPPYEAGALPDALGRLAVSEHLAHGAIVVAEHRATTALPDAIGPLAVWKRRRQGDAAVTFYRHAAPSIVVP
jgi:16S rRNA (guanine966-N2)-methyltransferase